MMSKILPSSRSLIFFILPLLSQPNLASNIHFKERPQNQTLIIGQNTTLRCSIYRQNGESIPVQILWRSKGIILSRQQNSNQIPGYSGRYSYIEESPDELNLRITNVSLEDNGDFQCQVLQPGGIYRLATAFIFVDNRRAAATPAVRDNGPLRTTLSHLTTLASAKEDDFKRTTHPKTTLLASTKHDGLTGMTQSTLLAICIEFTAILIIGCLLFFYCCWNRRRKKQRQRAQQGKNTLSCSSSFSGTPTYQALQKPEPPTPHRHPQQQQQLSNDLVMLYNDYDQMALSPTGIGPPDGISIGSPSSNPYTQTLYSAQLSPLQTIARNGPSEM